MRTTLRRSLVAGTAIAALALSACGSASPTTNAAPGSESTIPTKVSGKLTIGTDLTYPPYDTLENGKPAGFDVEFMDAVAAKMGVATNYVDTRFAQIIAGIKADRYDAIASTLYVSAPRAKEVDFVPYFQTGNSIISRADGTEYVSPGDLCGKSVGVVTATVIVGIMTKEESDRCKAEGKGAITVKEFPTDPEATQALLSNQVDAQMTDGAVAKVAVEKTKGRLKLTSTSLIYPIAVGIGVKKGDAPMHGAITDAIKSMQEDGSYDELLAKYNLEPVDPAVLKASMERK
ncbi:ABC transporter substrate-binding protein [Paeniglutamicibacter cryotolerans]|uniref:Polar amino acid transport system permease protein/polar amino acid transport system substrate-binding protein n=1 Tax=Paeniglutamicibacter cryotolerans TaxID=670079 RepID=A0A839QIW8_9MICC|nr:ABC transporter substrate-binding protein [Paeniglutamicibacter cryotolerans]MBB2995747.1 polar amino acid transport system permease protein/polar amino acid transport system substrate-binding protein [Paeniglutamicibacter cryotolerans]